MDPGHFLTGSGSKIPMPKSKKEIIVPVKPKLTTTAVTTTNYIGSISDEINIVEKETKKTKPLQTVNLKTTTSKSVPNLAKSTSQIIRSRTNVNLKNTVNTASIGVKRTAATIENLDAPAIKQSKAATKSGFPYKAKHWELKARLAECEGWVVDLRNKCNELETQFNDNVLELQKTQSCVLNLNNEREILQQDISNTRNKMSILQEELRSKSENYDKLYEDSKQFLSKIEKMETMIKQKDDQIDNLQTDQKKLQMDLLARDSSISQLRITVDNLDFSIKRLKIQIEDLKNCSENLRLENSVLQDNLFDKERKITDLQNQLDKTVRDNDIKTSNLLQIETEYSNSREEMKNLKHTLNENNKRINELENNLKNAESELSENRANGESLASTCEDLKKKLCESEKLRRYLHNAVQDLKGNIRVFCRVRPPIQSERDNSVPLCSINFPDEGSLEISKADPFAGSNSTTRPKFAKHEFSFDKVFNPKASQADIFDELSQLVQSALDGYNVCVFAYGQTGSGKTYTMEGENVKDLRGMIPRTVDHIFKSLKELELIGWDYKVEVSFLEIYNEIIRDLLRNDKDGSSLKIMQVDGKTNEVTIPGLTVMEVQSFEDLDRLYLLAHQNRAVAYTSCNERSSRSHSVTRIKVTGSHKERGERCYGSLYLVDLAGSERLNEPMSDPRFREMKNINKSLSELGNVILGLLQKQEHIPYRNSKLTHLLQPALGGSSKTLMLVNISPAEHCLQETLCSLRFAEKVNKVKMGTTKKRIIYDNANLR